MLKIRLKKLGRKTRPFYKIAIMENLSKRDGKSVEDIGYYDPLRKLFCIKKNRFATYIQNGAIATDTVRHLVLKYCLN